MRIEKATAAADLPHRFIDDAGTCQLCRTEFADPRHTSYEKAALLEKATPMARERGA